MELNTLADKVWYAYHCLPRDENGKLPSYRSLELAYGLSAAAFSKVILGHRTNHFRATIPKFAEALRVPEAWLDSGFGNPPRLPAGVQVPPRPGTPSRKYGDVPGWDEAVAIARARKPPVCPPEAFRAGAELSLSKLALFLPATITPDFATGVSLAAWEVCTPAERTKYSTQEARAASQAEDALGRSPSRWPAAK